MKITTKIKAHFELTKSEQIAGADALVKELKTTVKKAQKLAESTKVDKGAKVNTINGLVRMETLTENEHLALALAQLNSIETATEAASERMIAETTAIAESIGAGVELSGEATSSAQSKARNAYQARLVARNFIINNVGVVDDSSEL